MDIEDSDQTGWKLRLDLCLHWMQSQNCCFCQGLFHDKISSYEKNIFCYVNNPRLSGCSLSSIFVVYNLDALCLCFELGFYLSSVVRKPAFFICENKDADQLTAKLISTFVFATRIVQSLYFLNPKFQASSHLVWLYSLVCVGPGRKPRRPVFSQRGSSSFCSRAGWIVYYPVQIVKNSFFAIRFNS